MHKIIATIMALTMGVMSALAQSNDYQRVVGQIEDHYSLSSVSFSRETVQLLSAFDFDHKEAVMPLIDAIDALKLTTCRNVDSRFAQTAAEAFTAEGYEAPDVSDIVRGRKVQLFIRRQLTVITEAHIVSPAEGNAIFSVFGKFKMRDIRKLLERGQHGNK